MHSTLDKTRKALPFLAMAAFCLQVFSDNKADVDLWGNVGFVKALPWQQEFHRVNTYSFTEPDHQWINHEWLSEYVMHHTHARFGNAGLLLLKIALGAIVMLFVNKAVGNAGVSGPVKFLWMLLAISTMGYGFSTRPHLFTYAMCAAMLYGLTRLGEWSGRRLAIVICLLPLWGLAWANLHGAFIIGALILLLYAVLESVKRRGKTGGSRAQTVILFAAPLFFIAGSLVTPYGIGLWSFIGGSAAKPRPYLTEWAPFSLPVCLGEHPDFLALAVIAAAALLFSRKRRDLTWTALCVISFAAALALRRNIPLFAVTASFVVPAHLDDIAGAGTARILDRIPRVAVSAALAAFTALSAGYTIFFNKINPLQIEVDPARYPIGMVSFMKENKLSGNALVFFDWAEYCIWKLPECRVFLDGRFTDAYSPETVDDYFDFLRGLRCEGTLDQYGADIALIRNDVPALENMETAAGWKLARADRLASLFLRTNRHREFWKAVRDGNVVEPPMTGRPYFP